MTGILGLSFLRRKRSAMERQRRLLWQEHEAHFRWIEREKASLGKFQMELNAQMAKIERHQEHLDELWKESPSGAHVAGASNSLQDQIAGHCDAFEAALERFAFRIRRWREERERFHAIDRILYRSVDGGFAAG